MSRHRDRPHPSCLPSLAERSGYESHIIVRSRPENVIVDTAIFIYGHRYPLQSFSDTATNKID
ncbi:hypothetical protein BIFADO_01796 [Bifidobacterium adolescentis L2-32]|uniref:Uncharacterized protein n=1 Tax=Bifidobacterium adolescentis L2-32 TaxID=411481 RepID=A7A7F8_BIFAD|nr:hypothetical protein BIFADO_01796 [Bifidobacterium adolescentis L2-32]